MKIKPSRLRTIALAAMAAALVVVLLAGHGKPPAHAKTNQPVATPAVRLPGNPPTADQPVTNINKQAELVRRVSRFVRAYYLLRPGDTAAVRRRRIAAFAASPLLDKLALGGEKSRRETVDAVADSSQMAFSIKRNVARVAVPVSIYIRRAGAKTERYISLQTVSRWRWQSGRWVLLNFN